MPRILPSRFQAEINDDIGFYVDGLTFEQEGRKDPPPDAIYRSLLEHCRTAKYLELCHMTIFANDAGDNDGTLCALALCLRRILRLHPFDRPAACDFFLWPQERSPAMHRRGPAKHSYPRHLRARECRYAPSSTVAPGGTTADRGQSNGHEIGRFPDTAFPSPHPMWSSRKGSRSSGQSSRTSNFPESCPDRDRATPCTAFSQRRSPAHNSPARAVFRVCRQRYWPLNHPLDGTEWPAQPTTITCPEGPVVRAIFFFGLGGAVQRDPVLLGAHPPFLVGSFLGFLAVRPKKLIGRLEVPRDI